MSDGFWVTGGGASASYTIPSPTGSGTTYYVSPDGDDSSAGTSDATAWATLTKAVATATTSGDVVVVRPGEYAATSSSSFLSFGFGNSFAAEVDGTFVLLRAGGSEDADAVAYIAAVESADGEPLESSTRQAIQDFVAGCKYDGIWDSIAAAGILSGARTLTGALIPLKGAAPTNVSFLSGDYSRATGLIGNKTNKYLNLNRLDTAETLDDAHMSVYITEANTRANPGYLGAESGSGVTAMGAYYYFYPSNGGPRIKFHTGSDWYPLGGPNVPGGGPAVGFLGCSRNSGTIDAIVNGAAYSAARTATGQAGLNYFLFANNSNGGPQDHTDARMCWYSVGSSIDISLLKARLDALFAVIGAIT